MAWVSFATAWRKPDFRQAANAARLNEAELKERVNDEALGTATWARRVPTDPVAGNLNLQIDVDLAIANAMALTS